MKYIIVLLLLIIGMFYLGDHLQPSAELTYSDASDAPLSSTYTKKDYCSEEIDEEIARYQTQLNAANSRIYQLNSKLEEAKSATLSADASTDSATEEEKKNSENL